MFAAWSFDSVAGLVVMVTFGAIFAIGALVFAWRQSRMRGRATGSVTLTVVGPDGQTLPVVSFRPAGGAEREFVGQASVGSLFGPRVGESVPVRFDEGRPEQARIATFRGSYLGLASLLAVGLGALALAGYGFQRESAESEAAARLPAERIAVYIALQRAASTLCTRDRECSPAARAHTHRVYRRARAVARRSPATSQLVKSEIAAVDRELASTRAAAAGEPSPAIALYVLLRRELQHEHCGRSCQRDYVVGTR